MFDRLPQHPQHYKKRAFYSPIREWIFTDVNKERIEKYLSPSAIHHVGIFQATRVTQLRDQLDAAPPATNANEYYRMNQIEWILMLVLTVQILHFLFIDRQAPCFSVQSQGDSCAPKG